MVASAWLLKAMRAVDERLPAGLRARLTRPGWLRTFTCRTWSLFVYSETTALRGSLGVGALLWALFLALPGETMTRPVYRYMAIVGSDAQWSLVYLAYGLLILWRVYAAVPRPRIALAINVLGVCLTGGPTISIVSTLTYPFPAAVGWDIAAVLAALWVFIRTDVNSAPSWRGD